MDGCPAEGLRRTVNLIREVQQGVENLVQTFENGAREELIEAAQHLFADIDQRVCRDGTETFLLPRNHLERVTFNVSSFFLSIDR